MEFFILPVFFSVMPALKGRLISSSFRDNSANSFFSPVGRDRYLSILFYFIAVIEVANSANSSSSRTCSGPIKQVSITALPILTLHNPTPSIDSIAALTVLIQCWHVIPSIFIFFFIAYPDNQYNNVAKFFSQLYHTFRLIQIKLPSKIVTIQLF